MRSVFIVFLLLAVWCSSCLSKKAQGHADSVIHTENGLISGLKTGTGIMVYKGIPFAAPPIGNFRWKAPQPATNWQGVRKCDAFGPSPMQPKPAPFMVYTPEFLIPQSPIGEDCLYLNVWSGAQSNSEKRPVFVWIYGGGFSSGGSGVPIYDGEAMATKGLVFVSINYRVGVFGFLAHPDLTAESPNHASGNYGLLDQIAALKWIQRNIAAFGGDPNNVTIAGQSAGSMSVNCLVASPLAKGLFQKAIAESGSYMLADGALATANLPQAEQAGDKATQGLHTASISELRKLPADEVLKKINGRFGPIIDGFVLPESIPIIFSKKAQNKVPLLTGWNRDEGFVFNPAKREDFLKQTEAKYGTDAATFLKYYPAASDSENAITQLHLSRDMMFGLPNYRWATVQSEQGYSPVYVYYFTRKPPATGDFVKYGAFHTAEVGYALDNLRFLNRPWQPIDQQLATTMSSYWVNFAKTGNPNSTQLPQWPAFTTAENQVMVLNEAPNAQPLPDKAALDFLYSKMQ